MDAKTAASLYEERMGRIKKALSIEEPDRVPIYGMMEVTWPVHYAGYPIKEAVWDINTVIKAHEKLAIDFDFDIIDRFSLRSPLFYNSLGAKAWTQGQKNGIMQHIQVMAMQEDEYPELIADPFAFIVNKILPRLYTELAKPGLGSALALSKAATIMRNITDETEGGIEKLKSEYGLPCLWGSLIHVPFEVVANQFRTIKGMVADIWRRPEQVEAACEQLLPLIVRFGKACQRLKTNEVPSIYVPLHIGSYLRTKDFERLYWPTFKKLVETFNSEGYSITIFCEGDWTRFYDYLQELPPNKILVTIEQADMRIAKEKLGNRMCLSGGYPLALLQGGAKEECIKKAKQIIDAAAPGGGYIFGFDKTLLAPGDVKIENLKAVIDVVRKYGVYK
ncbi:uroporphyrinogen decarboxylase family protein [Sporomusa sp.]|uniref:uroporphyrinogen decarboxylase family protein n=1 Tax=Sporomusa sp. TaxID=2078658 RepID=UPI002CF59A14|nr:uroporphyrinogen decarboxylase family protein [Sporomusa sp.]HWR42095.1 uroporphyrinogen decarboxylase family protein [Sporomusa sp.]